MPELPEVETVRQVLRKRILNKTVCAIEIFYPKAIKTGVDDFRNRLLNQTILEVGRYGKYLLITFADFTMISHLRMEGKYLFREEATLKSKHDIVIFRFTDGTELHYQDVRKFGTFHLKSNEVLFSGEPLQKLGKEPFALDFNLAYLKKKLQNKRPIKSALLDQTILVGLGNIYVDEVLFRSKIHPETKSFQLTDIEILSICQESVKVLEKAIELGGSTIRTYYSDELVSGRFQNELLAHSRKDEPCMVCGAPIIKIKVGGRGTYLCPNCQIVKK